ncbi:hypothetical protein OH807_00760 [Kitasatospora sp. NBC_01560]
MSRTALRRAVSDLGRELTAAVRGRLLPDWATDAGRTEDAWPW